MKHLVICLLTMLLGLGVASAQKKTTVFKAEVTCGECAKKIMDNVPALGKGIADVQVNVEQQTVTVTYDAAKNNDANIVKGLASLKVKAAPVESPQAMSQPYCKVPPVKCPQESAAKQPMKPCDSQQGDCAQKSEAGHCQQGQGGCGQKSEAGRCQQGQGGCGQKSEASHCQQGQSCGKKPGN